VDGRVVGTLTATVALIVLGFVALGLYTSLPGLLIAGSFAAIAGAAAGALTDPARPGRSAAVVVGYIAMLILPMCLWDKRQADMLHQDRVVGRA
jgi:riboflavin transporter FmnP